MKLNNYLTLVVFIALTTHGCAQSKKDMKNKPTNALISETSPYLLQHAHNPVNWVPYSKEALVQAKEENKLVILSIGYSACHWCHVMEHESFEDSAVAALMNAHFVNIKIDREERPDLDNYYMGAVQLMTGRGGWPLNCITLPDGRPIWGGTYFPKKEWINALESIQQVYENDRPKVLEYADQLQAGIAQSDLIPANHTPPVFTEVDLQDMVENWKRRFDTQLGGPDKAPKFPLPNNYQFLLRYAWLSGDDAVEKQVKLTLQEMAFGGIYDQVGGGFARYSTDEYWKAPHFEKMLYDNAQLISLYSEAYRAYKNELYKDVVEETTSFLEREMLGEENQYYAALDADSEGEEGKFYVWSEAELKALIPTAEWELFADYYNVNHRGRWENNNYILLRNRTDSAIAIEYKMYESSLKKKVKEWNTILLNARNKRINPGLDNKALTAWNALAAKAFVDAYIAFQDPKYLGLATRTAAFIKNKLTQPNGQLWHTYSPGEAKIDGFLDDYATTIDAWIALYQATGDEQWLSEANAFTQIVLSQFDAGENALFHYTPHTTELLSRTTEISDNVIPASNSIMANNLEKLGSFLENATYRERAKKMTMQIKPNMYTYGEGFSNWSQLILQWVYPTYEVVIAGPAAETLMTDFNKNYYPNVLQCLAKKPSELPLFENRWMNNETIIYVCQGNVCQMPTKNIEKAWTLIKK